MTLLGVRLERRERRRGWCLRLFAARVLISGLALLVSPSIAAAEDDTGTEGAAPTTKVDAEKAKIEFAKGNSAYEARRYRQAAEAFERAHRLAPHAAVLFNAAKAWWKVGELERAADDYSLAIQRGELSPDQTGRARSALAQLRRNLGWVTIRGADYLTVTVGYHTEAKLPLTTHLAPGDHVLDVSVGGRGWNQIIRVRPNAPLSVVAHPSAAASANPSAAVAATEPADAPPKSNSARNTQKAFGIITLGLGVGLGAGAGVTGSMTLRANEEFKELNTGQNPEAAQAARDEATSLRTVTNILAFSGVAMGLTGFTLLLTLPKKKAPAAAFVEGVRLAPGRIMLSGRF